MTKRAVTYARVSGNDHAKTGGENLAEQTRFCREYALKNGYDLVADFSEDDRGASGATFDLPELAKVLDLARNGGFDVLIVRELDRLSRDLAKQLIVEQELKQAGVAIEYVLYDFPDTPEGNLNKNMRAMLAEYEREKIKQRMARGKIRTVKAGNVLTHKNAPFGYTECITPGGLRMLEIVESEAEVVRLIFTLYTEGDGESGGPLATGKIARKLTALRVPSCTDRRGPDAGNHQRTKNKAGHWNPSTISCILRNETYVGVWYYGKRTSKITETPIAVEVPAIIDQETWDIARERSKHNKRFSERNSIYQYLLAKRLRCGQCGCKVHALSKGDGRYLYYRCMAVYNRSNECTQTDYFRADHVDAIAWQWVRGLLLDEDKLKQSLEAYQNSHEETAAPLRKRLEIVTGLIEDREQQITRLLDLYLNGDFSRDVLSERKARITQELTELRAESTRLETYIREQTLSEDTINTVLEFGRAVGEGITEADQDFQKRLAIIDLLDVTGELLVKDNGAQYVRLRAVLCGQEEDLPIVKQDSIVRTGAR
jgi:site-specific DNA recombinase